MVYEYDENFSKSLAFSDCCSQRRFPVIYVTDCSNVAVRFISLEYFLFSWSCKKSDVGVQQLFGCDLLRTAQEQPTSRCHNSGAGTPAELAQALLTC